MKAKTARFTIGDKFTYKNHNTVYKIIDINLNDNEYDIESNVFDDIVSAECDVIDYQYDKGLIKKYMEEKEDVAEQHKMTLQEQLNIITEDNFAKQKEIDEGNRQIEMHVETIQELTEEIKKLKMQLKYRDKVIKLKNTLDELGLYIGSEYEAGYLWIMTKDNKVIDSLDNWYVENEECGAIEDCRIDA